MAVHRTIVSEFVLWSSICQNSKSLHSNQTLLQSLTRFGRCYSWTIFLVDRGMYYFYHFEISGHNVCDHVEYYIDTGICNIWLACLSISGTEYPSLLLFFDDSLLAWILRLLRLSDKGEAVCNAPKRRPEECTVSDIFSEAGKRGKRSINVK